MVGLAAILSMGKKAMPIRTLPTTVGLVDGVILEEADESAGDFKRETLTAFQNPLNNRKQQNTTQPFESMCDVAAN